MERVNYLLRQRGRKPVPGFDDEHITKAYRFIRRWRSFDLQDDLSAYERELLRREALYLDNRGLYHAYVQSARGPEIKTHELEAWILTGESNASIARRVGTISSFIDWYERLFFNVRDRLHLGTYITTAVLDRATNQGLAHLNYSVIAKFFAYHAGPVVLEALITGFDKALSAPGGGQSLDEFFADYVVSDLYQRLGVSINAHQINAFSIDKLLDSFVKLREIARRDDDERGKLNQYAEITKVITETIGWAVGSDRKSALDNNPATAYLGHAAEPRVHELVQVAQGNAPYQPDYLANKSVPPPRRTAPHDGKQEAN